MNKYEKKEMEKQVVVDGFVLVLPIIIVVALLIILVVLLVSSFLIK